MKDGSFVREYTGHKDDVDALCIWKNYLFSGSTDKTIRQWDILVT